MPTSSKLTLVCGGGGVWGVAWLTGLAMGLLDGGVDLRAADAFIGTSAGSVVSTHLALGSPIEGLFERQSVPSRQPRERAPAPELLAAMIEVSRRPWPTREERLKALCDLALEAPTISLAERRADIIDRLGLGEAPRWPQKPLSLTGVDLETQDLCVFDAESGVGLVDAVSASCAVPGVWPPAAFGGRRYVDGGVWRTADNAHLAEDADRVLILSPTGGISASLMGAGGAGLAADVAALEAAGARVIVITADAASLAAMAPHALDPATRAPAAGAGRAQGRIAAAQASALFAPG